MTSITNTIYCFLCHISVDEMIPDDDKVLTISIALSIIIFFSIFSLILSRYFANKFYGRSEATHSTHDNKKYFIHNYTCDVLNTLPCMAIIYDCNGTPLFCNNKILELIAPNKLADIPNLFESTIIGKEQMEKIQQGESVDSVTYLNFNDQQIEKIFGNYKQKEAVFKYHVESLTDSATKSTNYILTLYNATTTYLEKQKNNYYINLLRECINMTGINAYLYDVRTDEFYRLKDNEMVKTHFTQDIIFKQIAPKFRPQFIEMFLRLKNGEITSSQRRYPIFAVSTNRYYFVESYFCAVSDISGNVNKVLMCVRNVSSESKKQTELENLKDILTKALPVAQIRAWTYNVDSKCFTVTTDEKELTATYSEILERVNPEDRPKFNKAFDDIISGKKTAERITVRIFFSGKPDRMCEIYCSSKKANADYTNTITGIIVDCTELYKTRFYLDSIKSRTMAIADMLNSYIIDYNSNEHIFRVFSKSEMREYNSLTTYDRLFHPDSREKVIQLEKDIINCTFKKRYLEYKYMNDKEYEDYSILLTAYDFTNGKPTRYCGLINRFKNQETNNN